jgi:exopolyphosphatase / guanosine-5'-triphosphate,3'-diphosphate pyrophosphatase
LLHFCAKAGTGIESRTGGRLNTAPAIEIEPPPLGGRSQPNEPLRSDAPIYGALDLGTNNCRLLIARPSRDGFRVLDSFSRIVRLGDGLAITGRLNEAAIARTLAALSVCRSKLDARGATRILLVATEACRSASNGPAFIARIAEVLGLDLTVVDRETEAVLAASGCAALADEAAEGVLLFDIGGGSSEIVWLSRSKTGRQSGFDGPESIKSRIQLWTSLPLGVVTLADRFGGRDVTPDRFEAMVTHVSGAMASFVEAARQAPSCPRFHLLGTSGTVTTVAGVFLGLPRYDRRRVDGLWMSQDDVTRVIRHLRAMPFSARAGHGCIGPDRADLVLAGCAILEAIRRAFPSDRLRVADRGLREGILMTMMSADDAWRDLSAAVR